MSRSPILSGDRGAASAHLRASGALHPVGLPKKETYFTVQRDAMTIDRLTTPALYFGTTTGQLWIGRNGGEKFECLFDALPPIHNVKVSVV